MTPEQRRQRAAEEARVILDETWSDKQRGAIADAILRAEQRGAREAVEKIAAGINRQISCCRDAQVDAARRGVWRAANTERARAESLAGLLLWLAAEFPATATEANDARLP